MAFPGRISSARTQRSARRSRGDDEALIQIRAFGRDGERRAHLGFQVGLPELPAVGKSRGRGASAGLPCGAPAAAHCASVAISAAVSLRSSVKARLGGKPWRHVAPGCDGRDQLRAFRRILVGQQAEGRDSARTVARGAFAIEDRGDVVREGRRGRRGPERRHQRRKVHILYCALWPITSFTRSGAPNPIAAPRKAPSRAASGGLLMRVPEHQIASQGRR